MYSPSANIPVVRCKRCAKPVPTRTNRIPDQAVLVTCPLCGEKRQYLPTEVYEGRVDYEVTKMRL